MKKTLTQRVSELEKIVKTESQNTTQQDKYHSTRHEMPSYLKAMFSKLLGDYIEDEHKEGYAIDCTSDVSNIEDVLEILEYMLRYKKGMRKRLKEIRDESPKYVRLETPILRSNPSDFDIRLTVIFSVLSFFGVLYLIFKL